MFPSHQKQSQEDSFSQHKKIIKSIIGDNQSQNENKSVSTTRKLRNLNPNQHTVIMMTTKAEFNKMRLNSRGDQSENRESENN